MRPWAVVVASAAWCSLVACDLPRGLREDYMFKDILEPSRSPRPVERDHYGNAVVPEAGTKPKTR